MDDGSGNDHASPVAADEQQYDLDLSTAGSLLLYYFMSSVETITVTGHSVGEYEEIDGDGDMMEYGDDDAYRDGGFGAVPASDEEIAGLEKAAVGDTRETECVVCMESFEESDEIRKMPCAHGFHESCISDWLRVSRVCPCCRFTLRAADEKWTEPETEFEHSAMEEGYEEHPNGAYDDDEEGDGGEEEEGYIYLMVM